MKNKMSADKLASLIKNILIELGENVSREGLKDTPGRVARMYKESFYGYKSNKKPKIIVFSNEQRDHEQIIVEKGSFYSFCEHHIMPFFGEYYFAYIPDKKIVGLSKISRVVDYYASKLQVQERLTMEISNEMERALKPKGLAIIMSARHLCKEMRGVRKNKDEMITSEFRGIFENDSEKKSELLGLVALNEKKQ